jgi:hypothetical protein
MFYGKKVIGRIGILSCRSGVWWTGADRKGRTRFRRLTIQRLRIWSGAGESCKEKSGLGVEHTRMDGDNGGQIPIRKLTKRFTRQSHGKRWGRSGEESGGRREGRRGDVGCGRRRNALVVRKCPGNFVRVQKYGPKTCSGNRVFDMNFCSFQLGTELLSKYLQFSTTRVLSGHDTFVSFRGSDWLMCSRSKRLWSSFGCHRPFSSQSFLTPGQSDQIVTTIPAATRDHDRDWTLK